METNRDNECIYKCTCQTKELKGEFRVTSMDQDGCKSSLGKDMPRDDSTGRNILNPFKASHSSYSRFAKLVQQ